MSSAPFFPSGDAAAPAGRLLEAPEGFIDAAGVRAVFAEAKRGRRDFIRRALAAAGAAAAAPLAMAAPELAGDGDPEIVNLPAHSKGLGQAVATDGYGRPSKHEANVQRRQSPGLTQTKQASVSFAQRRQQADRRRGRCGRSRWRRTAGSSRARPRWAARRTATSSRTPASS